MSQNYQWSLEAMYPSFDSEALKVDKAAYKTLVEEAQNRASAAYYEGKSFETIVETVLTADNHYGSLVTRLSAFANLTQSTEAKHVEAQQLMDYVRELGTRMTAPRIAFNEYLYANKDALASAVEKNALIKEHAFILQEKINDYDHMLSKEEESIISKMTQTGSTAWEALQNKTTSLMTIPFEMGGEVKELPLSSLRNLAFNNNADVRKRAFHAELAAYPKAADISAAALNAIKGEVLTMTKLRGYNSPLEMSLNQSRMDESILKALLQAMEESLPIFRRYLKTKAKALGHEGALPFYDIFAPLGKSESAYDIPACQDIVEKAFREFSPELGDFAVQAFENNWVDFEPRVGKRGGAFCSNIYGIKESRVLTNYDGSMKNIITVAHELGHGFHGHNIFKSSYLNASYPMPLAETASTFCETVVKDHLMKLATPDEQLMLLDTAIEGYNQIIVDIYSRFLFETALFENRENSSLSTEELMRLMTEAQVKAYGDAIDPETLHPYMWMNKVHYYYAQRNFYNFPYAFGLLFSMGLYAKFQTEGHAFIEKYNDMLKLTGQASIKDVGAFMGIDLTDIGFWKGSLAMMERDIEKFEALCK